MAAMAPFTLELANGFWLLALEAPVKTFCKMLTVPNVSKHRFLVDELFTTP